MRVVFPIPVSWNIDCRLFNFSFDFWWSQRKFYYLYLIVIVAFMDSVDFKTKFNPNIDQCKKIKPFLKHLISM